MKSIWIIWITVGIPRCESLRRLNKLKPNSRHKMMTQTHLRVIVPIIWKRRKYRIEIHTHNPMHTREKGEERDCLVHFGRIEVSAIHRLQSSIDTNGFNPKYTGRHKLKKSSQTMFT